MTGDLKAAIAAAREREESWAAGSGGDSRAALVRRERRRAVWEALREMLDAVPADHPDAVRIAGELLRLQHAAGGDRRHAAGHLIRALRAGQTP